MATNDQEKKDLARVRSLEYYYNNREARIEYQKARYLECWNRSLYI